MTDLRLLVLDDDPMIGQTIESIAKSAGFESRVTTRPEEFFETLESWSPSHIALDLVMPDMDGVEVLVELARRESRARIVITSGVGSRVLDAAARSAAEHGLPIAGVVPKPFSPRELREILLRDSDTVPEADPGKRAAFIGGASSEITETEFEQALEREEFKLVYQPKVHCAGGELAGFEALVRWESPERGLISPAMFIPLAESSGLIGELTRQVIASAITWFSEGVQKSIGEDKRSRSLLEQMTLSINLSARSLADTEFIDLVRHSCKDAGIDPRRVVFELTETSAMEDPVTSLDLLTRLRMKGFQLSIDDFGTGFSSMLQLVRLPFSEIKIDKSFVMTAAQSEESRAVIRSVVELGHSLGLRTTAEGVEDQDTMEYLKEIGCDLAQGYLISRPLDSGNALDWALRYLKTWRAAPHI